MSAGPILAVSHIAACIAAGKAHRPLEPSAFTLYLKRFARAGFFWVKVKGNQGTKNHYLLCTEHAESMMQACTPQVYIASMTTVQLCQCSSLYPLPLMLCAMTGVSSMVLWLCFAAPCNAACSELANSQVEKALNALESPIRLFA